VDIQVIENFVAEHADEFKKLADEIWQYAELGYNERDSANAHITMLKEEGFAVRVGVAGIPTAFIAEAGTGSPIIGILGEFDALSSLSQRSLSLTCEPSPEIVNGNGHGCGHHLLGAGAHLAAVAVKSLLEVHKFPGTVRFYGCPAEEGGWGKTFMARAGIFNDLDAALTWHPWMTNTVWNLEALAVKQVYYRFTGISAHAGFSPHLGRSALDAIELMNVGSNYLREHIIPGARVHYAVTNSGGIAPNVVQRTAEVLYMLRAPRNEQLDDIYERVCNVARGAALMTGCELEIRIHSACSNLLLNNNLNQLMQSSLERCGAPKYDQDELRFAASMHKTVGSQEIDVANALLESKWPDNRPLYDSVAPLVIKTPPDRLHGSTDVGDVACVTPTAQCFITCFAFGTSPHSWQWVSQGKSSIAHKGMLLGAKTIVATAMSLFTNMELIVKAKEELNLLRGGKPYICPIPDDVGPPLPT
jgi:aminobenzoyl-glutamate utilization protein B